MLHAPCKSRITDHTLAKNFVLAGFCAFRPTNPPAGLATSGFKCCTLRASRELLITPLPKSLSLLGFVPFALPTRQRV